MCNVFGPNQEGAWTLTCSCLVFICKFKAFLLWYSLPQSTHSCFKSGTSFCLKWIFTCFLSKHAFVNTKQWGPMHTGITIFLLIKIFVMCFFRACWEPKVDPQEEQRRLVMLLKIRDTKLWFKLIFILTTFQEELLDWTKIKQRM